MLPVYNPRAGRRYSCGPECAQPDLPAHEVEADLLLAALIKCTVTRHPELGAADLPTVSADELRHWQRCDTTDRRAVLVTAYTRVLVNTEGKLRPHWRRCRQQPAPDREPRQRGDGEMTLSALSTIALLMLGLGWIAGRRYERAARGWSDYRAAKAQVPVLLTAARTLTRQAAFAVLLAAAVALIAVSLAAA